MSDVVQQVGQKSRSDGREPVSSRVDRLSREREALVRRKTEIEAKLSEIDSKRKEEQADLYRRRRGRNEIMSESAMIESRFAGMRGSLLKELANVCEELAITKLSLSRVNARHQGDEILLRIEALLSQILARLSK